MMYGFYNNDGWNCGPWGGFGGGIMMILFWILLIAFVIWIIREFSGRRSNIGDTGRQALDVLKERYAKGEIDQKEFEQKKKDLLG